MSVRVLMLGGTRFVGRRTTESLIDRGDEVLVVHRGRGEPESLTCRHLHADRADFGTVAEEVREFGPEAVVDTIAMTRADAEAVLPHLPDVPLVVLSSMDVYRAYELAVSGRAGEPLPITEKSAVRESRYPHAGTDPGIAGYDFDVDAYDKLDVEPLYLERGGTVLRLGMVYGEHDVQRREEFVLRRVRAGRRRIPIGAANWLWTRVHVDAVAEAVIATLDTPDAAGEVLNIGETTTGTFHDWIGEILDAADHEAELVPVPEQALPPDLRLTSGVAQHLLVSSAKADRVLGWHPRPAVARSVHWHLANPPEDADADFTPDDRALAHA